MSIDHRRKDLEDDRLKTAVAFGFGATQEEASEFAGKSLSSVKRWKTDPEILRVSEFIAVYRSISESRNKRAIIDRTSESLNDRFVVAAERWIKLTERAQDHAETLDDSELYADLEKIQNSAREMLKYFKSEAPKRTEFVGTMEHKFKTAISIEEARNILLTDQIVERNTGTRLIAGDVNVIDLTAD